MSLRINPPERSIAIFATLISLFGLSNSASATFSAPGTLTSDSTTYENSSGFNGGGYTTICVGNQTTTGTTRRAYLSYSLPSIPAGSIVTRVRLTLTQERARIVGGGDVGGGGVGTVRSATLRLLEVTGGSWTQGAGGGGSAACGAGVDVPGIDWLGAPSASASISATGVLPGYFGNPINPLPITIDSNNAGNIGLINDVQGWLDGGPNDGWMLRVSEEGTTENARVLTPGILTVYWVEPNGSECDSDNDCTTDNCVAPDGNNCGGQVGCVCCNVATCTGAGESCHVPESVGMCIEALPSVPASSPLGRPLILLALLITGGLALTQLGWPRASRR